MQDNSLYDVLQLTPEATPREIRQSFLRLAQQYHPDLCASRDNEDRFKRIRHAYEILSDPERRRSYDLSLDSYATSIRKAAVWEMAPSAPTRHSHGSSSRFETNWLRDRGLRHEIWMVVGCVAMSFLLVVTGGNLARHVHRSMHSTGSTIRQIAIDDTSPASVDVPRNDRPQIAPGFHKYFSQETVGRDGDVKSASHDKPAAKAPNSGSQIPATAAPDDSISKLNSPVDSGLVASAPGLKQLAVTQDAPILKTPRATGSSLTFLPPPVRSPMRPIGLTFETPHVGNAVSSSEFVSASHAFTFADDFAPVSTSPVQRIEQHSDFWDGSDRFRQMPSMVFRNTVPTQFDLARAATVSAPIGSASPITSFGSGPSSVRLPHNELPGNFPAASNMVGSTIWTGHPPFAPVPANAYPTYDASFRTDSRCADKIRQL